jgi:putative oxidoreductase
MSVGERIAPLIGRLALSGYFLWLAFEYTRSFYYWNELFESRGLTGGPPVMVLIILIVFLGGLGLLLGFRTQVAALVLFAFTMIFSFLMYDYWAAADASVKAIERDLFFKSLAIAGGLLLATGLGGGKFALDNKKK